MWCNEREAGCAIRKFLSKNSPSLYITISHGRVPVEKFHFVRVGYFNLRRLVHTVCYDDGRALAVCECGRRDYVTIGGRGLNV